MAPGQLVAVRGRRVSTCGARRGGREAGWEGGRETEQRCSAATVKRHGRSHARRRRTCYARGSPLHAHSHKTRRSSFLSSSLSKPGFASVLTLHASFSKEALGLSPAFSPAAVEPLSSLFLPPEPNIVLGKDVLGVCVCGGEYPLLDSSSAALSVSLSVSFMSPSSRS